MTEAFQYALTVAEPDVRDTLEWLVDAGFAVTKEQGGEHESFGNVLLQLVRDSLGVRISRDRGQWMVEISPREQTDYVGLNVLLTAMDGTEPDPGSRDDLSKALPRQLPAGVVWRSAIPAVIEWVEEADRTALVADSGRRWRQAIIRWRKRA